MASTDDSLLLYYHPSSFYSRLVVLTLKELNLPYKKQILNLVVGEHTEPWYMRIHPGGAVPSLKHGSVKVPNSDAIVDYLCQKFPNNLSPDANTELGSRLIALRKRVHGIEFDAISFGTAVFPGVAGEPKTPKFKNLAAGGYTSHNPDQITRYTKLAEENPDLKEAYEKKIAQRASFVSRVNNKEHVLEQIDKLKVLLDDVEKILGEGRDADSTPWLSGNNFTNTDIAIGVMIQRLIEVGLEDLISQQKRPNIYKYTQAISSRESFKFVYPDGF